jgi:Toprim domain
MYHNEYDEPTAHELARGLNAKQVGPNRWEARCPRHRGRSLSISVSRDGRTLVHCFGGCTQDEVFGALRDQDLWPRRGERPPRQKRLLRPTPNRQQQDAADRDHQARQLLKARRLWQRSVVATGTPVETYLRSRGIPGPVPSSLRFLPAFQDRPPAMIAAFGLAHEYRPGELMMPPERIKGVHLTLLRPHGSGKADCNPNKLMIGSSGGWPIVIAPVNDVGGLAIAEGIEDAQSLHLATGLGAWAAGSANRLPMLADKVPTYVEAVTLAVDGDVAGRRNAFELAQQVEARGTEAIMYQTLAKRGVAA